MDILSIVGVILVAVTRAPIWCVERCVSQRDLAMVALATGLPWLYRFCVSNAG